MLISQSLYPTLLKMARIQNELNDEPSYILLKAS